MRGGARIGCLLSLRDRVPALIPLAPLPAPLSSSSSLPPPGPPSPFLVLTFALCCSKNFVTQNVARAVREERKIGKLMMMGNKCFDHLPSPQIFFRNERTNWINN